MTTVSAQMTVEDKGIALRSDEANRVRWFSRGGCVAWSEDGESAEVFVGGELVGSFSRRGEGQGVRNALMVQLAEARDVHLGLLAAAFRVGSETLRTIRRLYESDGLVAIISRRRRGRRLILTPKRIAHAEKMFARGAGLTQVHEHLAKRGQAVSRETVRGVRTRWLARIDAAAKPEGSAHAPGGDAAPSVAPAQSAGTSTEFMLDETHAPGGDAPSATRAQCASTGRVFDEVQRVTDASATVPTDAGADDDDGDDTDVIDWGDAGDAACASDAPTIAPVQSGKAIQHAGAWLLIAMTSAAGLFQACERERVREERHAPRPRPATLRLALEALLVALAIGQRCVEGVRRIATPTAGRLLRATHAPSASWVRRVLGVLACDAGGTRVLLQLAGAAMRRAASASARHPAIFYVDNHLRTYTGKHVVRKGWRMQDRCVVPGITDCYVHDEDARAVVRIDSPDHEHLTSLLGRVAALLRAGLGEAEPILLAFDRAGAFPEQLAELRDSGMQFVTYERRPYPLRAATEFTQALDLGDGETLRWVEDRRKNLRGGRGRVRRIAVLTQDERQISLVAISDQSAEWLIGVMRGRWKQENAFKHTAERWGQNQLDARTVEAYPPETVIPNPARRRLDRALRLARAREGDARRELSRLPDGDRRRKRVEADIREAMEQQGELEQQRPHTPQHAPLADTELAGKLVRHDPETKLLVDAVRIACANAESELAARLAPKMTRPRETKKLLANLFASPGDVRVGSRSIRVDLAVAANDAELAALADLVEEVNALRLTLPGDQRHLVFQTPVSNT